MGSRPSRGAIGATHRDDIDGLRAVSVTAVVLHHLGATWLPGGFVGVDVFFVISGYLITGIIARESDEGRPLYMDADHLSRLGARRLAPLFAEAMAGGAPR